MTQPLTDEQLAAICAEITAALSTAGAYCGDCGFQPGETGCPDCVRVRELYADALMPIINRLCAERDQFADRVDTLTAVAKSNKRAVQEMHGELQRAEAERDAARAQTAAVALVRVWRNEDGKEFLFADDVRATLGIATVPTTT